MELGKERVEYVKAIAEIYCGLNNFQQAYVDNKLKERLNKVKHISPIVLDTDWPSISEIGGEVPPVNPEFFKQQELMSGLTNWLKTQEGVNLGFGAMASSNSAPVEAKKEIKQEEKVEVKKEKEIVDIYIVSFDAAKKISLIKEVRGITNLGLKESKELVETLPGLVIKKCKMADAKAIVEKLEAAGGKIELK